MSRMGISWRKEVLLISQEEWDEYTSYLPWSIQWVDSFLASAGVQNIQLLDVCTPKYDYIIYLVAGDISKCSNGGIPLKETESYKTMRGKFERSMNSIKSKTVKMWIPKALQEDKPFTENK